MVGIRGLVKKGHSQDAAPDDPAYRGFKFGAAFFGWLVAISMTALLAGVIGAIATGCPTESVYAPRSSEIVSVAHRKMS